MKSNNSKQRCKALITIGLSLIILLAVLSIGTNLILLESFVDIEKMSMEKNADRILNAIQGEITYLNNTNGDYAGWDESYRFIQEGNSDYIEKHIPDSIHATLNINIIAYVTNEGKIIFARNIDLEEDERIDVPESLYEHLSAGSLLLQHKSTDSIVSGILSLPEGDLLLSSRPILTNEYEGPIHGTMIMARFINEKEIRMLSDKTRLSVSIYRMDNEDVPQDLKLVRKELSGHSDRLIRPINEDTIASYEIIKDVYNKGVLIVKINSARHIYREGRTAIRYFILWFLIGGLIFSIASYLLFDKLVSSRRKEMESEERYHAVVEKASEGILILSLSDKSIIEANKAFHDLLGYSQEEIISMTLYEISIDKRDRIDAEAERIIHEKREIRLCRKDGSFVDVEVSASIIPYKDKDVMCLILHDITERKSFIEQLMHQANHDSLTGLANRNLLHDRLKQAMAYQKRRNQITAVLLLDLDNFKIVNDTLGHQTGDKLLKEVSQRLQRSVRSYDTVARLGGDEFVIIIADVSNTQDIITITENVQKLFQAPFNLNEEEIYITTSIGISLYPSDGDNIETLLMKADTALYHSKGQGRDSYYFFADEMNKKVSDRLIMETRLRKAIERDELLLHYQPKVDLTSGEICGMEALIRWEHPELGLISPMEFIPIAEESGLIVPIGEMVLRKACQQTRQWHAQGFDRLKISVNLSARQFAQDNIVDIVNNVLKETCLEPKYLELELTESILINHEDKIIKKLNALKEMGIMLSMDDFGTGYSSLSYLKKFPIGEVKIDRSFVKDIFNNSDGAALVEAILAMARSLKLKTVAEGVETLEQLMFLAERQCGEVQGYYFSRPLPANSFTDLLKSEKKLNIDGSRMNLPVIS